MSEDKQNFSIARIYTKDVSLESPKAPQIFEKQWNPKLGLDVDISHTVFE
jgi:Preprotein translocase subunit SecB